MDRHSSVRVRLPHTSTSEEGDIDIQLDIMCWNICGARLARVMGTPIRRPGIIMLQETRAPAGAEWTNCCGYMFMQTIMTVGVGSDTSKRFEIKTLAMHRHFVQIELKDTKSGENIKLGSIYFAPDGESGMERGGCGQVPDRRGGVRLRRRRLQLQSDAVDRTRDLAGGGRRGTKASFLVRLESERVAQGRPHPCMVAEKAADGAATDNGLMEHSKMLEERSHIPGRLHDEVAVAGEPRLRGHADAARGPVEPCADDGARRDASRCAQRAPDIQPLTAGPTGGRVADRHHQAEIRTRLVGPHRQHQLVEEGAAR